MFSDGVEIIVQGQDKFINTNIDVTAFLLWFTQNNADMHLILMTDFGGILKPKY